MPFVLTVDQQGSRRAGDRVPAAFDLLARIPVIRTFDRTAGDEFQGVIGGADDAVEAALSLARDGRWNIGIGCGPVEQPLPSITRAGRGAAFEAARAAVEAAKRRPQRIAVRAGRRATAPPTAPNSASRDDAQLDVQADVHEYAQDAEAILTLLVALIERRSPAGWEAVDLVSRGATLTAAATTLGVTRQAVGQRLATAQWQPEVAARSATARSLLRCLRATGEDPAA
jgi:hypothetical protein